MKNFKNIFSNGNQIFFKYLWSQMLDCIIVAITTSIAMSIMGVKYSVLLGILIGISNLVPYFGAIFGVTIAIIITLLTGGWGASTDYGNSSYSSSADRCKPNKSKNNKSIS